MPLAPNQDGADEYLDYLESGFHDVDFPSGFCKKCGMFSKISWARFPGECSGAAILHNMHVDAKGWKE